jgi:hypothetical protein
MHNITGVFLTQCICSYINSGEECVHLRGISILFALTVISVCAAFARSKTDVVEMKNGDRITGEVKTLENGVLKLDLDYVDGSISINWLKVARLESRALFRVRLQDGSVYLTSFARLESPPDGQIKMEPSGQGPLVVDKSKVVGMTQSSESLLERASGQITLGTTYSKGNQTTQYNIGSEFDYVETRWGAMAVYDSNLSSSTGAAPATRNQANLMAYRLFPWRNYYYAGTSDFLQSSVQGIERRTNVGAGIGRYLKNTNRVRFTLLGGFGWQRDRYVPSDLTKRTQNTAVSFLTTNLDVFSFKKTRLSIVVGLAPTLSPSGRLFTTTNVSYYLKVFGKVDWNLSFYGNWDTQPPTTLRGSDYGSSTGLSWTFGNK